MMIKKYAFGIAVIASILILAYNVMSGDIFNYTKSPTSPTSTTVCLMPTNPDSIVNAQTIRTNRVNTTVTHNGVAKVPFNTFYLAINYKQQDEDTTIVYMYAYDAAGDSSCIDTTTITPTANSFSFVTLTPIAYPEAIRLVFDCPTDAAADTNIYKNAYLDMRIQ